MPASTSREDKREREGLYIDCHVHFWEPARGDYGWLTPEEKLFYRDILPDELEPHLLRHGVEGVIAVQAAGTVEETEYLLRLSSRHDWIRGVVGWIDIFAESFTEDYGRLRLHPRFAGIRLDRHVWTLFDGDRIPSLLLQHLRLLAEEGLPVDLLIQPDDMPKVLACLRHVPELKAVVNHLGSPGVHERAMEPWRTLTAQMAEYPNMACKLSGMITQTSGYSPLLRPYVRFLCRKFGAGRLMLGSDWPVCLKGGSYGDAVRLFEALFPEEWPDEKRNAVRKTNALSFYGIHRERKREDAT